VKLIFLSAEKSTAKDFKFVLEGRILRLLFLWTGMITIFPSVKMLYISEVGQIMLALLEATPVELLMTGLLTSILPPLLVEAMMRVIW